MSLPKPYYETELGRLYHADCLDILPHLEPVDLVLTDPPYGTEDLGGGYGRRQNHDPNGRFGRRIKGDKDLTLFFSAISSLKILNGGALVSFCAARRMNEVDQYIRSIEFNFLGELIWDKGSPGLGYTIRYSHESALVYSKGYIEIPKKALLSVVRFPVKHNNTEKNHPHEKPIVFWINALRLKVGIVLDPFIGHGNTAVACERLKRRWIGIEIEEKYCEIAAKRIEKERSKLSIFDNKEIKSFQMNLFETPKQKKGKKK